MIGQTEIVVGTQQQNFHAVQAHMILLGARYGFETAQQTVLP
jgi:hypothetical protein